MAGPGDAAFSGRPSEHRRRLRSPALARGLLKDDMELPMLVAPAATGCGIAAPGPAGQSALLPFAREVA